jgi:GNAT superfamily N-acetyltransferase
LILAFDGPRLVGFVHASFAPNADESGLSFDKGIIAAIMVHPDSRRQGIGTELVRRAEEYLRSKGAQSVVAGGGLNQNGFYCGIYGGLEPSGFCGSAAAWREFFSHCGYAFASEIFVLRRDLLQSRDPVNAKLLRHRRHLNLVITDRPSKESWWWFVRYGHLDSLRFELQEKANKEVVASGQIIGMDLFIPKWGVRSVGIREIFVPEIQRRHGYAQALVLEICRRLRGESVQLVEAHVDSHSRAAIDLFTSAKFELNDRLLTFRKALTTV